MADATGYDQRRFIGYGRQSIDDEDVDAVVAALRGDFLTQGHTVPKFERALSDVCGAKYVVAVSSATAGLHLACLAAGMTPGTVGVTQPITFVASANCIAYCGAEVELADIDGETIMMCPDALASVIERRPATKVVIPVSYAGLSSRGHEIREVVGRERIIIEDASHSFGAREQDGRPVGSSSWADMTVFSFHPVKPITTAEGGAVVTNDPKLYERLCLLRSHGIERNPDRWVIKQTSEQWWYEQQSIGYNYRLSDIHAALGISQARRIDQFLARRRRIAELYDAAFSGLRHVKLVHSDTAQRARSGHHLYVLNVDYEALGFKRGEVVEKLRSRMVGTQVHYIPIYKQPYYRPRFPDGEARFPVSEAYYRNTLTIPCFPTMTEDDVLRVVSAVTDVVAT